MGIVFGQIIAVDELRQDSESDFLDEVRAFLARALREELRAAGRATTGVHSEIGACREWHRLLWKQGWIAPSWPRAHGGTGWSARRRFLFDRECAENDAPILFAGGIRALGPLLMAAGTPAQQARYLPAILDGRDMWCQGFSEAGAGSDLAAVTMRAVRDGDRYRLTGRKIWTTGAQHANRMFLLARTSHGDRPQHGLTFLLADTDLPGLAILPIRMIDGECDFNEVIFDDVAVPVENRVGAEGEGWNVARQLMRFARGNNTTAAHLRRALRRARALPGPSDTALADTALADTALAEIETRLAAYESLELSLLTANRLDGSDEMASSMLKTIATELNQAISELGLERAGPLMLSDTGLCTRRYLATRAASIYSGTNEVHRNLMARHLLA